MKIKNIIISIITIIIILIFVSVIILSEKKITDEQARTNPKTIDLKYTLKGEEKIIEFKVYEGLNNHLAEISEKDYYGLTWKKFIIKNINQEKQKELLLPLINKIKNETLNEEDRVRIAVSLVQNIPYDDVAVNNNETTYRYPYETIYDNLGVCGDKSLLLVFILRELSYGVVTFDYEEHRAVGIKCEEFDYQNTGYCFIESNIPSIITDDFSVVNDTNTKKINEIVYIFEGKSFNATEEHYDLKKIEYFKEYDDVVYMEYSNKLEEYNEELNNYILWSEEYEELYNEYSDYYDEEYEEIYDKYNNYYEEYKEVNTKYGLVYEEVEEI